MMRWKLAIVAMLALPLAASADGLLGRGCGGGGCASGNCGGFGHGIFANQPCGRSAGDTGFKGFGFFQPPFQAAPWYLYWPYDQHFQMPAPINAPYFAPQAYGNPGNNPYFAPAPTAAPRAPGAPR